MARGPAEPPRGRPAELPEWFRPPDAVLPVVVQQPQTLVRTKEVVVALREIAAYPTGFTLTFAAFHRSAADARLLRRTVEYESLGDALVSGGLRCEVGFSDGSRGSTAEPPSLEGRAGPPSPPVVRALGSEATGGILGVWGQGTVWVWPLPPHGPVAFVLAWRRYGIDPFEWELEAETILRAAERATVLWPDD